MSDVPHPTPGELFAGFFGIGIIGFGGVLPWARRMVVEQRRWLTPSEFTDLLALCQVLPGPNVTNMAVALGSRFRGLRGVLAALAGLLTGPFVVVLLLGGVYQRFGAVPVVQHAFVGLAAAASGLVVALAVKIAAPLRGGAPWAVAAVSFAAIGVARVPLLPAMFVLAPASVLLLRWRGR